MLPATALRSTSDDCADEGLVLRAKAGDTAAFELLMRRHNQRLYRTARAVLRDDAEAEDVVQEAWVRVYQNLGRFRGDAAFSTWATRIALHEAYARLRRRALPFEANLRAFLEATLLQHETDHYDPRADRVTLMTLHAAKGLEFPVVLIPGCEETLLPYTLAGRDADVEEERRLFYVGMTRAQRRLILLHARRRTLFGQRLQSAPSRFLLAIEETLKELKAMAGGKAKKAATAEMQLSLF